MEIDLDKLKAARREADPDAPTVKFGGESFELPRELPFELVDQLSEIAANQDDELGQLKLIRVMTRTLLGEREEEFLALSPSLTDIQTLITEVYPMYGLTVGESSASES